jgi:hypothetical protein
MGAIRAGSSEAVVPVEKGQQIGILGSGDPGCAGITVALARFVNYLSTSDLGLLGCRIGGAVVHYKNFG